MYSLIITLGITPKDSFLKSNFEVKEGLSVSIMRGSESLNNTGALSLLMSSKPFGVFVNIWDNLVDA